jgi:hypothetical protein
MYAGVIGILGVLGAIGWRILKRKLIV